MYYSDLYIDQIRARGLERLGTGATGTDREGEVKMDEGGKSTENTGGSVKHRTVHEENRRRTATDRAQPVRITQYHN